MKIKSTAQNCKNAHKLLLKISCHTIVLKRHLLPLLIKDNRHLGDRAFHMLKVRGLLFRDGHVWGLILLQQELNTMETILPEVSKVCHTLIHSGCKKAC